MITMDEFVNRFTKWLDDAKRSMDKEYHSVKSLKDLYQLGTPDTQTIKRYFTTGNVVLSWWQQEEDQLHHGDAEDQLFPTQLSALHCHEILSVTCGADHTIAFESSMQVYSWGW
ncbi:hypothetical protein ACSBR2_016602 [Camellia fascicularis]